MLAGITSLGLAYPQLFSLEEANKSLYPTTGQGLRIMNFALYPTTGQGLRIIDHLGVMAGSIGGVGG